MAMKPIVRGLVLALVVAAGSQSVAENDKGGNLKDTTRDKALSPRLQNLGTYSRKVSTSNPQAQKYFDQGLMLAYAFNHAEAVRSFREAQRLDPQLAIAYWGEAYALGPNINAPMFPDAILPAFAAVEKAVSLKGHAQPWERGLIDAVAKRYVSDVNADRKPLDAAYAEAMQTLAKKYPNDPDLLSIAAESMLDTSPWNYWTNDGHPRPHTMDVVTLIEKAIALRADHPLALHLHIHALEASNDAPRAVASGDRLLTIVPGAGHLVHMPAHIFFRVGRYGDAAAANERAIAVDEDYISQCKAQGIYPAAYYPHNAHFLWIAYSYQGHSADAIAAARKTASNAHDGLPLPTDQFKVAPLHAMVKFAQWDEVLKEPRPAEKDVFTTMIWHWARGMALTNKSDLAGAESELAALRELLSRADFPSRMLLVNSPPERLGRIGERLLAGQIAWVRKDMGEAIGQFSSAVWLEDSTTYNEPPDWPYPTRHYLGAALLAANQPVEAEAVYLEDLRRRPENGWGLFGLVQAIKQQGGERSVDLAQAEARWQKAWSMADIKLVSSRW
ncbi:MAG: hypothetical protein ACSLE5_13855 [Porticoccaceae bacterium]